MSKLVKRYRRYTNARASQRPKDVFVVEIDDIMSDLTGPRP